MMNEHWQEWVAHNLGRGSDPVEIHAILVKHKFKAAEIKQAMGDKYPPDNPNPTAKFDASWREWLATALDKGSDRVEIRDILLKNHFTDEDIRHEMGQRYPNNQFVELPPEQYDALTKVRITRTAKPVPTDRAQLYVLENFMTEEECEELIALSSDRLRPSTVARMELYNDFRTSSTCDLVYIDHPLVQEISIRCGRRLGINPTYSEGIQVQRYEVGQYFKAHMDYFEPHSEDYEKYALNRGNRTWTFMVYLNETTKGGGTDFPELGQTFYPKIGMALAWNNLFADGTPNPATIHAGLPIEEGSKVIITNWFRELGKGQMIID